MNKGFYLPPNFCLMETANDAGAAMGVKMDAAANNCRGKEAFISAADSKVKVLLIPTDEELMIARDTAALCK